MTQITFTPANEDETIIRIADNNLEASCDIRIRVGILYTPGELMKLVKIASEELETLSKAAKKANENFIKEKLVFTLSDEPSSGTKEE